MHLEMSEAITVGFFTLPMKNKHRSSQAKCPQQTVVPDALLLESLCSFLSDPHASFKTPEQAEALEVAMHGKEHLLLIGPGLILSQLSGVHWEKCNLLKALDLLCSHNLLSLPNKGCMTNGHGAAAKSLPKN